MVKAISINIMFRFPYLRLYAHNIASVKANSPKEHEEGNTRVGAFRHGAT
jgi:hypothetical protein